MKKLFLFLILSCLTYYNYIYGETSNGTVTNNWLMIEDFESYAIDYTFGGNSGMTAKVQSSPTNAEGKSILLTGSGNELYFTVPVTLPVGKVLADYDSLCFDLYYSATAYRDFYIFVNETKVHSLGNFLAQNASNLDKGTLKYAIAEFNQANSASVISAAGNSFNINMGCSRMNGVTMYIDNIKLYAENDTPDNTFTAILNPGTGTCDQASVTETEENSGVTLPTAIPSVKCGLAGWSFAGWSETSVSETTTAPTLLPIGQWAILSNTTLYAVYVNEGTYNTNPACSGSLNGTVTDGWLMIDDIEKGNIGDTYNIYAAENSNSISTTATIAADPLNAENQAILFSNKNYGHYLQISIELPCNRKLGDYETLSFDIYSTSDLSSQSFRMAINKTNLTQIGNGTNNTTAWYNLQKAIPAVFADSELTSFTLEFGFRTSAKDFYIDNIKLKEKEGLPPCANVFTATLNPGTGTCEFAKVTESEEGAGITLPSATSPAKCTVAGYTFAGWSTIEIAETQTAPTLIAAGAWAIQESTTLYAVYTNGTDYNTNPVCKVSLNGTVTDGWLMVEDFENATAGDALVMDNIFAGTVVGTASVIATPGTPDETSAHILAPSSNYNTLLKLTASLPVGKTLADYDQISFDIYRNSGDSNNKQMKIYVKENEEDSYVKAYEDSGYPQQAPATTWTTKTYDLGTLDAINSFILALGIGTDGGNYLIDNIQLHERPIVFTYTVTFNAAAGTCDVASLTEEAEDAGVTLPIAVPSSEAAGAGWTFAGWSATVVSNTATAPALLSGTYYPTEDVTLYAVYTDATNYNSYPTTSTSANGTVTEGWLMVEDFEGQEVNASVNIYNFGGYEPTGTALVSPDPLNVNERAVHVVTANYDNLMELTVTLPAGKTLAAYDQIAFDFYWGANDYKKMFIYIDEVNKYEDSNYISQGTAGEWTAKSYDLIVTSDNSFKLALGLSTNAGNYYIDNIKLREKVAYTVTFVPGGGTCDVTSLTEEPAGSGVTLPVATPSTEAAAANWTFAGWAAAEVQNTTTAPELFNAASTYNPTGSTTLYVVYTDGTNYNSYPTTSVSINGTVTDGWLMVEDFEGQAVNTSVNIYNFGGYTPTGTALVSVDPDNANERALHMVITDYNNIAQLTVTLPAGKTLADYDQIAFDFYWETEDYKKMMIYVDGEKTYEDEGYVSQGAAGEWTTKTYDLETTSDNTVVLALGISTDAGNYYIDNVKLHEESGVNNLPSVAGEKQLYFIGDIVYTTQAADIQLFDLSGRMLQWANNTQLMNISNIPAGTYVVKATIEGESVVQKIIK